MNLSKCYLILMVFLSIAAVVHSDSTQTAPNQNANPEVSPSHKKWLDEEVGALISDYEKKAFLSLKTFEDREKFIDAFWEDRDPTPGTKRNEYREEFEERLVYVKANFNREGSTPAWKTERGRIWLKLGKPRFRKRFPGDQVLYPSELWHYTGVHDYGLPETFYVLFFQKYGIGAYKIYSPAGDGIESLVQKNAGLEAGTGGGRRGGRRQASSNVSPAYAYLNTIDPELAFSAYSLIPTEPAFLGDVAGAGIVSSEIFLGKLENTQNYGFEKRQYVERILKGRPHVDVYYSLQPQEAQWGFYWFRAPSGDFIIDYGMQLPADKLDMGKYDKEFYTALAVEGTIQTAKENTMVEKINSRHEIRLSESDFNKIRYSPFQFLARRMIVPGNYKIAILLRNETSKTMLPVVEELNIPDVDSGSKTYISPLLLVQNTETVPEQKKGTKPFEFGNAICYPLVEAKVAPNKDFSIFYQLLFPKTGRLTPQQLTLEYEFLKGTESLSNTTVALTDKYKEAGPLPETVNILEVLKPPAITGNVKTIVRLKMGDKVLSQSQPLSFEITPAAAAAPWRWTSGIPDYDSPYNKLLLAEQYGRLNRPDRARALLEQVNQEAPDLMQAKFALMRLSLKEKQYQRVLDLGHDLEIKEPRNYELLWLLGWAHYGLNQFTDAVRFFERARLEDPKNVQLLNVLANSYCNLNETAKCLEIIGESLKMNPDQPDLIRVKEKINAEPKKTGMQ